MNCLWCDRQIIPEINWENIFMLAKPKSLCGECEGKLEYLQGSRCKKCSRLSEEAVCLDCKWWNEHAERDSIAFNYSIFNYNSFMQDMIAKWKYRGDYVLGTAFKLDLFQVFSKRFAFLKNEALLVPIPLSEERLRERGFNQAKMLAEFLPLPCEELLTRIHGEKQSKKTRTARISTNNPFKLTKTVNKSVILVDDIYTTGTTLRHAGSLLKAHGCPEVYAFTLIRG
ncbi:competence protein ComFC [Virgibacillus halotolerans]|uniref:ComF family protein n=1 Tax=Virgibacillus halotolerans TaxID=1071053 RepID=UPI0019621B47|nr:ComF family protein [Virgibacillus halotolerans]MBM7600533.1 competence protein ComFC [Virgibacillus halotolerans]